MFEHNLDDLWVARALLLIMWVEAVVEQVHRDSMLNRSMGSKPQTHCVEAYRHVPIGRPTVVGLLVACAWAWVGSAGTSRQTPRSSSASMFASSSSSLWLLWFSPSMDYQQELHDNFVRVERVDGRMVANVVVVVASDVVDQQPVAVAVGIYTMLRSAAAAAAADSTSGEWTDALDRDVVYVKYIGTLNLQGADTSMDVDADGDDVHDDAEGEHGHGRRRVVVACDKAWNVFVLPSFVVDQDDNRPSDQLRI